MFDSYGLEHEVRVRQAAVLRRSELRRLTQDVRVTELAPTAAGLRGSIAGLLRRAADGIDAGGPRREFHTG